MTELQVVDLGNFPVDEATPVVAGPRGQDGADGASAYEVAVANGFVGTEAEWLASLAAEGGGGAVDSVNGQVGVVVLDAADVGADPAGTAAAASTADRARDNHTGMQTSATISDFTEAVQDAVAALLTSGTNVTLTYDDAANSLTVTAAGGDAEVMRDTIGAALVGVGNVAVTVNDAADTITISTTATANATDAALRDRSTHTGTQTSDTISDLSETVQDLVAGMVVAGTNVTKTYDDTAGTLTITATGGGSGVTDPTTTKGDLLVRDATGLVRFPVGPDGSIPMADSSKAAGIKWGPDDSSLQIVGNVAGNTATLTVPAGVVATDYAVMVNVSENSQPGSPAGFTNLLSGSASGAVQGNHISVGYRTGLVAGDTVARTGPSAAILFVRNMTAPPTAAAFLSYGSFAGAASIPARTLALGQAQAVFFSETLVGGPPSVLTPPAGWLADGTATGSNNISRASIFHSTGGTGGTFTGTSSSGTSITVTLPGQLSADSPYSLYQAKDVTTDTPSDKDTLTWDAGAGAWKPMPGTRKINAQTGTAYTLALTDAGAVVTLSNAGAVTLTVPTNATVAFPIGTTIKGAQIGVGQVTIAGASGVTVNGEPGLKTAARYSTFDLLKTGTDTWLAYGRLSA